ncbi:MAG TPA: hypothetical protein VED01_27260 [Burkholderiales bacterium]|nr:hypothetical protein [Burkholderiales bacterium]
MNTIAPLAGTQKSDPQVVRQWAAEDFAISIGLLRECPFHGQPYKAHNHSARSKALAAGLVDPLDPVVQIFNGNTRELLAAAERIASDYGERCEQCAASDSEDFD